jgi:hypothetical protein
MQSLPQTSTAPGTFDGAGAGDHDEPYRFGRTPRSSAPYPFSTGQFVRLLIVRGRFQAGAFSADTVSPFGTLA